MPFLHKHLGNPVLSMLGRRFFHIPSDDFHYGIRAVRRNRVLELALPTSGMEFASEMEVRASLAKLRTREVPTILWPDGRSRAPHLQMIVLGVQGLGLAVIYAAQLGLLAPPLRLVKGLARFSLERGFMRGALLMLGGAACFVVVLSSSGVGGSGPLDVVQSMRLPIVGSVPPVTGFQLITVSFTPSLGRIGAK